MTLGLAIDTAVHVAVALFERAVGHGHDVGVERARLSMGRWCRPKLRDDKVDVSRPTQREDGQVEICRGRGGRLDVSQMDLDSKITGQPSLF